MAIPDMMTAVQITAPGGPRALQAAKMAVPQPASSEILVKVTAAGVNRPDILQREGNYAPPHGASPIPGLEISGEVVAAGDGAERFRIGSKVCALVPGGGYAEYCVVNESNALPVPAALTMVEAAAIPETFFTVWHNVFERGGLQKGETLLVHGGASGIGTTAIQLASKFGSYVIATAGSDEKCAALLKLGADRAINYKSQDFVAATKEATEGKGANVILDMVGGDYISRNYEAAAMDGRIVQIAFLKGARVEADFRPVAFKARLAAELEAKVWPLFQSRAVVPVIDMIYPLKDAWRAHERMEESLHVGKIMLDVG
jgi:putative PIG3 family NAD(P)H quinone oxidoreductase